MRFYRRNKYKLPGLLLGVVDGGSLERRIMRLIEERVPWGARWRIAATTACAAVMAVLCVGWTMMAVRAQERAITFEVVSIKQNKTGSMGVSSGPNRTGYSASNVPLVRVILEAYLVAPNTEINLPVDRLKGAPAWVMHDPYDVTAKADEATIEAMKGMTQAKQLAYEAPMLQAMLADRFKLATHTVSTEVQGYALVVGKHGIKMKEAPPGEPLPARGLAFGGTYKMLPLLTPEGKQTGEKYVQITMAELTSVLGSGVTPVVDQTGLAGKYDFDLPLMDTGSPGDAAPEPRPDIAHTFDWEAIGLEMKPIKAPVLNVVIDHIERPSAN